jgi:hypothetical protein
MLFFTKGYDDTIENAVKKVRPVSEMTATRMSQYYLCTV